MYIIHYVCTHSRHEHTTVRYVPRRQFKDFNTIHSEFSYKPENMATPEQFTGFMIKSSDKWSEFTKEKFTPKVFEDNDVDIENECCGVSLPWG